MSLTILVTKSVLRVLFVYNPIISLNDVIVHKRFGYHVKPTQVGVVAGETT
jgi:hypothetical protein